MASNIVEFFGYSPQDHSTVAIEVRRRRRCPFLERRCVKILRDGEISGVCTLKPATAGPVICCPIRLYAKNYEILRDIARVAFEPALPLLPANARGNSLRECIVVFGKG